MDGLALLSMRGADHVPLKFLQAASAETKKLAQDGKCWDAAEEEFKLPDYAEWRGYANNLPYVARRYCGLWGRGT